MEIILKKEVTSLGVANDLVTVKNGYARNYLIPQGFAVRASADAMKQREADLQNAEAQAEALLADYKVIAEKLSAATVTVGAKVGTTDKIFGSVTTHHLAESIKTQLGIDVDRKALEILGEEIKTLGDYKAAVTLHAEVSTELNFTVVAE
ncbi:MAG: 50S ribosomal protein L9 [Chitinophagales bacterium]